MSKVYKILPFLPLFLLPLNIASAQNTGVTLSPCPSGAFAGACNLNANSFSKLIGTFIQAAFVMATVIALGYLIYGAIRWIMSQGDKSKVTDARNHIIAAVIGLVIVFLAYLIINVVLTLFFGVNITQIQLPAPITGP